MKSLLGCNSQRKLILYGSATYLQSSNAETLTLQGALVFILVANQPILSQILPQMIQCHFSLNDNLTSLVSVQVTKIHPTSGTFVQFSNADDSTNYAVKYVSQATLI